MLVNGYIDTTDFRKYCINNIMINGLINILRSRTGLQEGTNLPIKRCFNFLKNIKINILSSRRELGLRSNFGKAVFMLYSIFNEIFSAPIY